MENWQNLLKDPRRSPLFVVPENRGIRRKIFWEVTPVTGILELIKNGIENLSFAPLGGASPLFLGQQGLNERPFLIRQTTAVWHF